MNKSFDSVTFLTFIVYWCCPCEFSWMTTNKSDGNRKGFPQPLLFGCWKLQGRRVLCQIFSTDGAFLLTNVVGGSPHWAICLKDFPGFRKQSALRHSRKALWDGIKKKASHSDEFFSISITTGRVINALMPLFPPPTSSKVHTPNEKIQSTHCTTARKWAKQTQFN